MQILKDYEEFLDKVALEILKNYFDKTLPQSDNERVMVSNAAYKQALAMLQVKLSLGDLVEKTPYLNKYKPNKNKEEQPLK